jgi:hypothetical protein
MKKSLRSILIILILLLTVPIYSSAEEQPDVAAIIAAEGFLKSLDHGDYTAAWKQVSTVNQNYSSPPEWYTKILAVRPYLGQVTKRSLEKLSRHDSWVGLPDGDYLRISFTTVFQHKKDSLETVVLVKEQGKWVTSSYHLR